MLLATSGHRNIFLWDVGNGRVVQSLDSDLVLGPALAFSPDGRRIAAVTEEGTVELWDCESASKLPIHSDAAFGQKVVSWSPNRSLLAVGSSDGDVSIWDCYSGLPAVRLRGASAGILQLAWSPDSQTIAAAGASAAIFLWNVRGGLRRKLDGSSGAIHALAWSPIGGKLASGGAEKLVRIWDSATGQLDHVFHVHEDAIVGLSYSHDAEVLASKSSDGTICLWDCESCSLVAKFEDTPDNRFPSSLAFHPGQPILASIDACEGVCRIWDCTHEDKVEEPEREQIFISYSHKDHRWLTSLQEFLEPFVRREILAIWDDTRIRPGDQWRIEIEQALSKSKIAVLLVTPNFLASEFIAKHELQPLLNAANKRGLRIFWIAVSASLYVESGIESYQAANDPSKPLDALTRARRNQELVSIAQKLREAIDTTR